MFDSMSTLDLLKMVLPIIIIELALKTYCLVNLFKNGAKHLPKWGWALIIIGASLFGPIGYLVFGKRSYN